MATTLKEREVVAVANVVRMGDKLTIPEKMTEDQAIATLMRFKAMREEVVAVNRTFEVFPWDGAVALNTVLADKYGWSNAVPTPGFFGPEPPQMVTVEVGFAKTVQVPWGRFSLPGIEGFVQTVMDAKRGRACFALVANVKRKWEEEIKQLFDKVEEYLQAHSIYRGQAFSLDFNILSKEGLVEPKFIRTDDVDPEGLIFSDKVNDAIETNVFTPLTRYEDTIKAKLGFKRGVLLTGPFGVGKTLAARVAAHYAVENKITFIECPKAEHLAQAIAFVRGIYEPCVVFCEDIDRETEGDRTATMDTLLNIVDGVDSKNSKIMVVLTTNAVEKINPAMIRPGRLDAVIDVQPPDGKAIEKLLRLYGKGFIEESEDLTDVGRVLDGNIPAVIAEVVKRSKLAALKRAPKGTYKVTVNALALLESAETMKMQLDLLYNRPKGPAIPTIDMALRHMVIEATAGIIQHMAVDGDKLVMKDELVPYATAPMSDGKNGIKLFSKK